MPQRAGMRLRALRICAALVLVLHAATAQDTSAPPPNVDSGKARAVPFASLFAALSKTLPKEEKVGAPPPMGAPPQASSSQEAPPWGTELVAMAEMCNEGVEAACTALGQQDEAELA